MIFGESQRVDCVGNHLPTMSKMRNTQSGSVAMNFRLQSNGCVFQKGGAVEFKRVGRGVRQRVGSLGSEPYAISTESENPSPSSSESKWSFVPSPSKSSNKSIKLRVKFLHGLILLIRSTNSRFARTLVVFKVKVVIGSFSLDSSKNLAVEVEVSPSPHL